MGTTQGGLRQLVQQQHGYHGDDHERLRLERRYAPIVDARPELGGLVSYVGNKSVPGLRLYRYKEAFSLELASQLLRDLGVQRGHRLIDPFCGMGTTLLAGWAAGVETYGIDRLPVAAFVARSLTQLLMLPSGTLTKVYNRLQRHLDRLPPATCACDVPIVSKAFPAHVLRRLCQWKAALDNVEPEVRQPFQLLIMSALEPCSLTSKDGQFLRLVKRTPEHPDVAIARAVHEAELDIARAAWLYPFSDGPSSPTVVEGDAQLLEAYPPNPSHALITSPPYPNRYDYTRTYALELCLFFVHNARELRDLRHSLLRSHIEAQERPDEAVPHEAVREVLDHVRRQPLNNPRIPIMLKGYFVDMQRVLQAWSCVMAPGSQVAVVVDNVRFAGEIVPTDLILTDMAARLGFRPEAVWVCRLKGNSSQQMGTYGRVPVRESILLWRRL